MDTPSDKPKAKWDFSDIPIKKRSAKAKALSVNQLKNDTHFLAIALQNAVNIEQMIHDSDGEITPELQALIESQNVNLDLPESVDLVRETMERLSVSASHMKEKVDTFKKIQVALQNAEKLMKERVKELMVEAKLYELPGNTYRFVCSERSAKVDINEELLPVEYTRQVIEVVPDRDKIKVALERGEEVPGCELVPVHALTHYINKMKRVAS